MFDPHGRNLGDRGKTGLETGSFQVDNNKHRVMQRLAQGGVDGSVPAVRRRVVREVRVRSQSGKQEA